MAGDDCKIKCSLEHLTLSDLQCNLVCDQGAQGAIASHGSDTAPGAVSEFAQVALSLLGITYGSAPGRGVLSFFGPSKTSQTQDDKSPSADLMGNVSISSLSSMPSASLLGELGMLTMLLATPAAIFGLWQKRSPEQEADERIRQKGVEKMYSIIHTDKTISSLGLRGYDQLSRTERIDRLSTLETEVDLGVEGMDITVSKRNGKIKISYKGSRPTTLKEADLLSEDRARQDKAIQKLMKAKWFQEEISAFERNKIVLALKKGDFEAVELAAKGISVTVVRPRPKVVIENKTIQEGVRQMVEEGKPLQVMTRLEEQKNNQAQFEEALRALTNQRRIISSAMEKMAEAQSFIEQRPEISELSKEKWVKPMDILSEMVLARYKLSSDADQEAVSKRYGTNGHEVPIDWVRDLLKTDALLHDDIISIQRLQPLIPYHGQLKGMESYDVLSFNAKLRLLSTIERRYNYGGLSEKNHMMLYKLGDMKSVARFLERNPHVEPIDLATKIVALWELMTEEERAGVKKRFWGTEFKLPDWEEGNPFKNPGQTAFSNAMGTSDDLKHAVEEMKIIPEGWIGHVLDHPEEYLPDKRVRDVASMIIVDEQLRSMGWNSDDLSPREHLEKLNEIVERALVGRINNLASMIANDEQLRSMRWNTDGLTDSERQVRLEEIIRRATGGRIKGLATAQEIDEQIRSMGWNSDDLEQSDNLSELRKVVKRAIEGRAKDLASMIANDEQLRSMEWNSDDLTDVERQDRLEKIIRSATGGRVKDNKAFTREIDQQIRSMEWNSDDLKQPDNLSKLMEIVERALKKQVEKSPSKIIEGILKKSAELSSGDLTQIIKNATARWVKAKEIAREIDKQIRSEGWSAEDLIQPDNLSKLRIIVERALEKQVKDLSSKIAEDEQLRSMKWSSDPSTDGERQDRLKKIIESSTGGRVKGEWIVQEIDEQVRFIEWNSEDLNQPDNLNELREIVKRSIEEDLASKIVEDKQLRSMRWISDPLTDRERQLRLRKIIARATGGHVDQILIMREIDKQIRSMKWNADDLRYRDNLSKLREIVEREIESSVLYRRWSSNRSGHWNISFEVDPQEYALRQRRVDIDFNTRAMSKEIKALRARYDAVYNQVAQMPDVLEKASEHGMDAHGVTRIIIMYEHFFATEVKPEWVRLLVESPTYRVLDPVAAEEAAKAKAAEMAAAQEAVKRAEAHRLFQFGIADTAIAGEQGDNKEAAAARQAETDVVIDVEEDEDNRKTIPTPEPEEVRKEVAVTEDAHRVDDAQKSAVEPSADFEDDEDNRKTQPIIEVPEEVRKGFADALDAQKAEAPPSADRQHVEAKPAEKPAEKPRVGDTLPTGVVPTPEQLARARQAMEPSGEAAESKPPSAPPVSLPPPKSPRRKRAAVAKPPLPRARPSPPVSLPPPTPTSFPKRPAVLQTIPSIPVIRGVAESGAPSSPPASQPAVESAPAADSEMGSLIPKPPESKPQKRGLLSSFRSWLLGPKGGEDLLREAMQRDMAADDGMPRPKPPPLPQSPPVVEPAAQSRPKPPPLPSPPPPPPVEERAAKLPLPPPPPPPVVEPASVIEPPSTSHVRVKATGRRLPSTPPVLRKASVPPPPPPVVSQRGPTVDELISAEMSRVENDVPSGVRTRYVPPQPARYAASGIPPPVVPHHSGFLTDADKQTLDQLIRGVMQDSDQAAEERQARQKARAEQRKAPRIPSSKPRLLPSKLPSTPPRLSSPKLPSTPPRLSLPKLPSTPPRLRPIDGAGSAAQSGRPQSNGEAKAHISEGEARKAMSTGEARAKASRESRRARSRRAKRASHK